ncbi:alpha/beta fold hydrolase [Nocardia sp. NPDC051929]|uniref:alpha/beta fold hydrolase n=1 Tax=unclassified Nocardia TaxID=2637762 RepID=UPI0034476B32
MLFAMSTFVLVHGGSHGAWCWFRVIPLLEAAGHRVVTPDLPGHGVDRTPLKGLTLHDYAASIESVLLSLDEPAVLVGHSMGGMTVTLVAERCPDRIQTLVYLSAIVLSGGQSMMTHPAIGPNIAEISPDFTAGSAADAITIPLAVAPQLFYGGCAPEDVALALRLLTPEPLGSFITPVQVTPTHFGRVRRTAILTMHDVINPPEIQRAMYKEHGITEIAELPTAHSPFFSAPELLAQELDRISHLD